MRQNNMRERNKRKNANPQEIVRPVVIYASHFCSSGNRSNLSCRQITELKCINFEGKSVAVDAFHKRMFSLIITWHWGAFWESFFLNRLTSLEVPWISKVALNLFFLQDSIIGIKPGHLCGFGPCFAHCTHKTSTKWNWIFVSLKEGPWVLPIPNNVENQFYPNWNYFIKLLHVSVSTSFS